MQLTNLMQPVLIALLVGMSILSYSQSYVKISGGYGVPLASQSIGSQGSFSFTTTLDPETGYQIPRVVSTDENVEGSYGSGLFAQGAFGYMFSDHLGVEGQFGYQWGKEYELRNTSLDSRLGELVSRSSDSELSHAETFMFSPLFVLRATEGMFTPYLMFGPVVGWSKFYRESSGSFEEEGQPATTEEVSIKYSGGWTKGARAAVGIDFKVRRMTSLFAEIVITGMNYSPGESEVTHYQVNGEDRMESLTVRQRKTVFVDKVVSDTEDPIPSQDDPAKSPRVMVAMSSLAANIGIKFSF